MDRVWAAARVLDVDADSREFNVLVTEWDNLPADDPAYEEAYEEGPLSLEDEGTDWRRRACAAVTVAQATYSPPNPTTDGDHTSTMDNYYAAL